MSTAPPTSTRRSRRTPTAPAGARRRRRWVRLLALVGAALLALVALAAVALTAVWVRADLDTTSRVEFTSPLAIPPLADSRIDPQGWRVFDLNLRPGSTDFGLGRPTPTWGVNGPYLGPTLRAAHGEQILVNVTNGVGESTSLHWHGMHLPARMDGGMHQPVAPGGTWSPTWTVDQPAATLWYHPHLHGETAEHVYRGLAGMFILDDPDSRALDLPDTYGVDDLPVIVQDKAFTDAAELDDGAPVFSPVGFLGDTVVVNGTIGPFRDVTTDRVRLRLLNASNARTYNFGVHDNRPMALIGTDGGLLPAPVNLTRVRLSPGERAEVVVTMRPGEEAVLRSYPTDLRTDFFQQRFAGGDDTLDVLALRAADVLLPSPPLPARLAADTGPRESEATTTRTFDLRGTDINDRDLDPTRIDEVVTVGDTEIWEVTNTGGSPHSFHVHDVQFRVVSIDGREPPPALRGPKDTVYAEPDATLRLAMTFRDYTDPDFPYMFHCHLLLHEDAGMMGQFVVVRPGEQPGASVGVGHQHGG
jgi:FtsP/CotA-like multicopper oxidase with cupredoxin domain